MSTLSLSDQAVAGVVKPPPAPPTVYAIALSKGGSTKTTTAAEVICSLVRKGRKVLAIDLEQQGNLTVRLGVTEDTEVVAVAAEVLTGDATAQEAAIPAPSVPGAWVLVGTHELADLDSRPEVITSLRDYLPTLAGEWDDIVIDTPPALGLATLTALAAADVVIAPVPTETESYDQLKRLEDVIAQRIAPRMRPGQRVHWIVPTKHDERRLLDREIVELLNETRPGIVAPPVRESVKARDAYTDGMPVSIYAPGSGIADDYDKALQPVIDHH